MTTLQMPAPKVPAITVGLRPFDFQPSASGELPAVSTLLVTVCALPGGTVRLEFALEGHIGALRVPESEAPPSDPLWQHTCFEAFISAPDGEHYREYNFSPAGQWAASEFLHYREHGHALGEENPALLPITSARCEDRLTLTAEVPPMLLPTSPILRIGLAAVIEHEDGSLEYWAVHHPAERPDFHHADGWTLRLDKRLVTQ
ncbi:MAG: DOMON-like domain-containing protein [Betaproteobacteria bacterium]|nr:DOMON-like domain-containing protein [Betaproteobacteria bacterium]